MASEKVLELTDENFQEQVLDYDGVALVDFWAEWCMPCKMLAPTIDEIAEEYEGKAKVGKVDTDNSREVAMKYGISAIPTVIVFKSGEVAKKFVGLQQKGEMTAAMDEILG